MSKSSEHCWGDLFTRWQEPEEEWFWRFKIFSKLKTAFCEYWTIIKIKISMICVSKEYDIKTKMVQEEWLQLKMTFLIFCWVELTFGGGDKQIFGWWGGLPPSPPVGKTLYIYVYIYYTYAYMKELCQQVFYYNDEASCASNTWANVAILLLSTLCVTDIYGIYFHLSVQCS